MPTKTYIDSENDAPDYADIEHGKRGGLFYWATRQPGKTTRSITRVKGKSMAFEHVQENIANLPNWAKIGLIGIAAILTYLIIKHRSSSTASTGITDASGAAGGIYNVEIPPSGVLGGTSGGGGGSSTTPAPTDTTTTPSTTIPPIVSGGSPPKVAVSPEGPWTGTIPANKINPAPLTPMRNYHTGFSALPLNVQPPETFNQVYESVSHGLAAQPANSGISGTNSTPPYNR